MTIHATICYLIKNGKTLLIKKSPGMFGEGKWNGLGGRLEENETPEECAIRETFEESGLKIRNPKSHGIIEFYEENELSWVCHIFSANNFSDRLQETDEGILRWFDIDKLPFDQMWEDDEYWVPLVISGKNFNAKFYFTKDFGKLLNHEVRSFNSIQEQEVQKMIDKLKTKSFEELEDMLINKRIRWFKENKDKLNKKGSEVRKAFEMFILKSEQNPKDFLILEETDKKIVWRSFNFCPVLEACRRLGLDTGEVCKKVYEKSTQVFIEQLNPKLKFGRSYKKIRPYNDYCEEWIELVD